MTTRARFTYTVFVILFTFAFQTPHDHTPKLNVEARTSSGPIVESWAVRYIKASNKALSDVEARMLARYALDSARAFELDAELYLALIKVESGFKPEATSSAGAIGLTQVIPRWHRTKIDEGRTLFGVYSLYEPKLNLYVGARTLREMFDQSSTIHNGLLRYNGSLNTESGYANKVLAEAARVRRFRA